MKKGRFYLLGVFFSLLATFAFALTPAAAAAGQKSISLISAQYDPGKGVVFKFNVQGNFSKLNGSVTVGGKTLPLSCNYNDFGELACTASQGLSSYVGATANITIDGYQFTTIIKGGKWCYGVYDYYPDNGGPPPSSAWGSIGQTCQFHPAHPEDWIIYYNPDYSNSFIYEFSYDGSDSCWDSAPNFGAGFYFDCEYFSTAKNKPATTKNNSTRR